MSDKIMFGAFGLVCLGLVVELPVVLVAGVVGIGLSVVLDLIKL